MIDLLSSLPGAVAQGLIWGIMAVGVYITYKLLDIADLTVDGSICTGAAVCTMMLLSGRSLWLAVLCAVAAGLLAGVVTGLLHIWLGIPPILAGILTQMTLWSVNLKILGKANQGLSVRDNHVLLSQMDVPGALVVLAIAAVLVVAVLYLFFGTELGCSLRATGSNANMARAQGINTDFTKVLGLVISNGLVALSGALLVQYNSACEINMGRGAIVIGLAAVIIGEVILSKVFHNFALLLLAVRYANKWNKATKANTSGLDAIAAAANAEVEKDKARKATSGDWIFLIGLSLLVSAISQSVGAAMNAGLANMGLDMFDKGTCTTVFVTVLGLICAMTPLGKLPAVEEMSNIYLYAVVSLLASTASVTDLLSAPMWVVYGMLVLVLHVVVMFILSKIFHWDLCMVSTASLANIGGSASAPIVATAYDASFAGIGVLMGVLGAAIGNLLGLGMGAILHMFV